MRAVALLCLGVAVAHPVNLECNDPRFEAGYQAMHVPVQTNQNGPGISLTADTYEYTHGSSVQITVKANSSKYVDSPYGVYLALLARPILGWKGDYGVFSSLTGGLNLTAKTWAEKPCTNTVVSTVAFTGEATLTWTAGAETYGDVTISLLWGNGLGPDDPLAPSFPNVSHAYLYLRTMTLKGPPVPSTPPVQLSSDNKCVVSSRGAYNFPHSPVFVQKLRTFPSQSISFPAGQCIACRADSHHRCRSARIECPSEPGRLAIENLFMTRDCSGSAVVSKIPTFYGHCPGAEYHSPDRLDLERFVGKLQRDHVLFFPNETIARSAISEYRRLLYLIQKHPDLPIVPSKLVDLVWHEHILDTQQYKKDCQSLFGRYIHHAPSFGDDHDEATKMEKESMLKDQASMFEKYVELYEDEPRTDMWPTAKRMSGAGVRLPDCCKALCVKPNCASCVGCNAVKCGKAEENAGFEGSEGQTVVEVLPEHFAGYVPMPSRMKEQVPGDETSYLCSATPMPGMNLSWTIAGDIIYMKQALEKVETWYSVGFSDVEPYDMSYADFIVTMFNRNYSGVRDMYKYDAGNNYPCWDVLTQCSSNNTAGTLDLKDRTNTRENGLSMSTWNRKLITGDYKDSPITDASKKVLFARGIDDWFTYHGKAQATTCDINFFSGSVSCGAQRSADVAAFV